MSKLFTCAVLHPLSHNGDALKAGEKVDLTAKELNQLLSLKEQPVQDPRTKDVKSTKDGAGDKEPPTPVTEAQIVEAIGQLDLANSEQWTKGNKPKTDVLTDLLSTDISAAERDAAWEVFQSAAAPLAPAPAPTVLVPAADQGATAGSENAPNSDDEDKDKGKGSSEDE